MWTPRFVPVASTPGSGSVPGGELDSFAVAILSSLSADELERRLRLATTPVIGRIVRDRYLLDVRTISDEELNVTAARPPLRS